MNCAALRRTGGSSPSAVNCASDGDGGGTLDTKHPSIDESSDDGDLDDLSGTNELVSDDARADREWEAMKSGSAEVCAELKRRRDAKTLRPSPLGPRDPDHDLIKIASQDEKFCHRCERISIFNGFQRCPQCNAYGTMSAVDAEARERAGTFPPGPQGPAATGNKKKRAKIKRRAMVARSTEDNSALVLEEDDDDEEEVLNAEDEKEIEAALDSGCVKHVVAKNNLPATIEVVPPPSGTKDFVGAGGHGIRRHGKAQVVLIPEEGETVGSVTEVADVTRPLHSVGQVADTEKEILFTKGEAVVVPAGALSRYLKGIRIFARYKRRGGLYLAKMKVRDPKTVRRRSPRNPAKPTFGRQGAAQ